MAIHDTKNVNRSGIVAWPMLHGFIPGLLVKNYLIYLVE